MVICPHIILWGNINLSGFPVSHGQTVLWVVITLNIIPKPQMRTLNNRHNEYYSDDEDEARPHVVANVLLEVRCLRLDMIVQIPLDQLRDDT